MKALLYLDDSMVQSECLDWMGRGLAKDIKFNLFCVTKHYSETGVLDYSVTHGRSLLSGAAGGLTKQGCRKTECVRGLLKKPARLRVTGRLNK